MKILNTLFFTLLFANSLTSQTYYYVHNIMVEPSVLTVSDNINIKTIGDFSGGASFIDNINVQVNDFEIFLTVNCATSGIGTANLIAHTETIPIGMLPAGDYHINLSGTALGNMITNTAQLYFHVEGSTANNEVFDINEAIKIYPNPTHSFLRIQQTEQRNLESIKVYDSSSKIIYSTVSFNKNTHVVDISNWPKGIYFVHYIFDGKRGVKKVVVI